MSFNRLPYDICSYKHELAESVGEGMYRLGTPPNSCEPCHTADPRIKLQSQGVSISRNTALIDIDSELKRINHYDDKCFYDNYKVNPSSFKCHQDVFTRQTEGLNYMKGMVNYNLNVKPNIKTNCIQNPGMFPRCPQSEHTPLAKNHHKGINNNNNQTVKYKFTNEGYCREFACQKLFNNFTKRSSNSVDERAHN